MALYQPLIVLKPFLFKGFQFLQQALPKSNGSRYSLRSILLKDSSLSANRLMPKASDL